MSQHSENGREFGYGNVEARPKADGDASVGDQPDKGSESNGGAYNRGDPGQTAAPDGTSDEHAGQSRQGYAGHDNDNATSTRDATHDRAS